jgi:hypothetical protein
MTKSVCVSCRREIDAAAKLCPYCGADPTTGEKLDTRAILDQAFHPREISTSESLMEYARHRQGVVIGISVAVAFLILAALHQFVTVRNASAVTDAPAVPLTEVADLSNQPEETENVPMPDLEFQHAGEPKKMRTFVLEPGAVPPPEVIAAQQAAQQRTTPPPPQKQTPPRTMTR